MSNSFRSIINIETSIHVDISSTLIKSYFAIYSFLFKIICLDIP
jgi:hypothetical protein